MAVLVLFTPSTGPVSTVIDYILCHTNFKAEPIDLLHRSTSRELHAIYSSADFNTHAVAQQVGNGVPSSRMTASDHTKIVLKGNFMHKTAITK